MFSIHFLTKLLISLRHHRRFSLKKKGSEVYTFLLFLLNFTFPFLPNHDKSLNKLSRKKKDSQPKSIVLCFFRSPIFSGFFFLFLLSFCFLGLSLSECVRENVCVCVWVWFPFISLAVSHQFEQNLFDFFKPISLLSIFSVYKHSFSYLSNLPYLSKYFYFQLNILKFSSDKISLSFLIYLR